MASTTKLKGERRTATAIESPVGAYPIKFHLECAERTRKDVSYPEELKVPNSDGLQARLDSGIAFEAATTAGMLAAYRELGWQVVEITAGAEPSEEVIGTAAGLAKLGGRIKRTAPLCVSIAIADRDNPAHRAEAEELTRASMAAGAHVILGGRLVADGRVGEPDLLIRTKPHVRRKHAFLYHAADFKDHRSFQGKAKPSEWEASSLEEPYYETSTLLEAQGVPQLVDSLQLAHYWYLLDSVGRAGGRVGGIVGREGVVVWRDLDAPLYDRRRRSAFEIYDEAYVSYRDAVRHERARLLDPTIPEASSPEWKTACKECPWREVCHEELRDLDHITLLPGVTPLRAKAHYAADVHSIRELATLDHRTARLIDARVPVDEIMTFAAASSADTPVEAFGLPDSVIEALHAEEVRTAADVSSLDPRTALYSSTGVVRLGLAIDQARVVRAERVHRARGVEWVSIPRSAIELDIDIEDDGGGICYLIGVREARRRGGGVTTEYIPFVTWDHTLEGEARNFAEFWAYLQGRLTLAERSKIGAVRAFYFTDHETRYFRHLAEFHRDFPGVPSVEEVNAFCASDVWVDLYPIMAEQLIWPTEDLTLKSLAKYARHMWRDETPGGANSVAWYTAQHEADLAGDTETRDELRQRILDYNEDDVIATWALREFISKMGEARRPGLKLPGVERLDTTWGPNRPRTPLRRR